MQTVILAAGQGTRMRPLTDSVPKPMLPVADRPLSAHAADIAVDAGTTELVFVVGYGEETVREHYGDAYRGVPVTYATQTAQHGTADAVRAARPHLEGAFVVLNGDNLYDSSVAALYERCPAIAGIGVPDPSNYGVLSTDGGRVTDIVEKPADPPSTLANAGAYAFPGRTTGLLDVPESERGEYELTDVVDRLVTDGTVGYVQLDRWLDVGRPWELLEANKWKLGELDGRVEGTVHPSTHLGDGVVVEAGASIGPGVVVEGPVLVRAGASVGPNAYVRGATYLGEGTHVGQSVELKNSVVMAGTAIPHLSYVGDSVLGRRVNLGAGTNVANLRHDGESVRCTVKGERVSTDRRKFGLVAGDGVKTGINTSLDPGVTLSSGARTEPGEHVNRDR